MGLVNVLYEWDYPMCPGNGATHAEFPCKDLQGSCKSLQFSFKIKFARNFLQDNGTFPLNLA